MALSGENTTRNAGEWAELYVLLKTLADGKLFAADGDLEIIKGQYFPVMRIEMQTASNKKSLIYEINIQEKKINVIEGHERKTVISMPEFGKEAQAFFYIMSTRKPDKQGKKLVFKIPEILPFMKKIYNPETKSSSDNKADIHMVIHDIMTGYEPTVGFSIKSKHSQPATLINPSGLTLFKYKISHPAGVDKDVVKKCLDPNLGMNGKKRGPKERIQSLCDNGYILSFETVKGEVFSENLAIIILQ